jgi:hypothetical protein
MKPWTRKEYEENLRRLATEAFKHHDVCREVGPGHWRIKREGESFYWADIVVLGGGSGVAVWGDIEAVVFAYGHAKTFRGTLGWISGWNLSYQQEKAAIGMTGVGDTTTDDAVAIEDVRFLIEQYREDRDWDAVELWDQHDYFRYDDHDEVRFQDQEHIQTLNEAIRQLRRGHPVELVRHFLFDSGDFETEDICHIGEVVAPRVAYAVGAINRLVEILEEKEKEEAA